MKMTSAAFIGCGLINILSIPHVFAASNLTIEERLNQLESRLQKAESRANLAEQQNVQLHAKIQLTEQQSQRAQKATQDLEKRTKQIENVTPDDNGYFELHGYARSGMMTTQNARHAQ